MSGPRSLIKRFTNAKTMLLGFMDQEENDMLAGFRRTEYDILPWTLTSLSLEFCDALESLEVPLATLFPVLERLRASCPVWVIDKCLPFPPTLTDLELIRGKHSSENEYIEAAHTIILQSLTRLLLSWWIVLCDVEYWPPNLQTLKMSAVYNPSMLKALPSTLTSLNLSLFEGSDDDDESVRWWKSLPKSITSLGFTSDDYIAVIPEEDRWPALKRVYDYWGVL
jgi:hypothetical protein